MPTQPQQREPTPWSLHDLRGRGLTVLLTLAVCGCGYVVGNPYPVGIRTIHVPTFTNATFRRGYELQLTEAVHKEIQDRTPFRLVRASEADTILTGHIQSLEKRPTNQTRFDDPRELELQFIVEVRWEKAGTGELLKQQSIPVDQSTARILSNTSFTPETGQSLATATQQAVDKLARDIVGLMEATW